MNAPPAYEGSVPRRPGGTRWLWIAVGVFATCGCICPVLLGVLLPVIAQMRVKTRSTVAINRAQKLSRAILLYQAENDMTFPPGDRWQDLISGKNGVVERDFQAVIGNRASVCDVAMSDAVSKQKVAKIANPSEVVMLFDSTIRHRNAHGNLSSVPVPGRYGRKSIFVLADGHVLLRSSTPNLN